MTKKIRGIRDSIPAGFVLGRTGTGNGPVSLVKLSDLASKSYVSQSMVVPANPSATASDTAVNGTASTFMRSDAAPAIQKASATVFGVCKADGSTITSTGGVLSASGGGGGAGTPPTIVQSVINSAGGSAGATLGAAPTNGNLLVAICFSPTVSTAGAGWTLQSVDNSGTDFNMIMTKVAGAGESATQNPLSASTTNGMVCIWELSGQHATFLIASLSGAQQAAITGQSPSVAIPVDMLVLAAECASQTPTISAMFNMTQDQIVATGTRHGVMGHADASTKMGQMLVVQSASGNIKGCIALIH